MGHQRGCIWPVFGTSIVSETEPIQWVSMAIAMLGCCGNCNRMTFYFRTQNTTSARKTSPSKDALAVRIQLPILSESTIIPWGFGWFHHSKFTTDRGKPPQKSSLLLGACGNKTLDTAQNHVDHIYLSVCLSIHLSIYLPFYLPI